jgi:hypothetical protein
MLNLTKKLYRKDYTGEDIVQERTLTKGKWETVTEYVPNNVINNQISNRAVVFGNGTGRQAMPIHHILNKKSGLLGADSLQSYACNAFYRDHTPDFLVVTNRILADELVKSGYTKDNIVYTRVDISLEFPKNFYLVPHDPYADAGTTAAYIAAFDGHKKIYLLGFNGQSQPGINDNIYAGTKGYDSADTEIHDTKWIANIAALCRIYNDVDFVRVTETGRRSTPETWKSLTNLRQINFRDFVLETDL